MAHFTQQATDLGEGTWPVLLCGIAGTCVHGAIGRHRHDIPELQRGPGPELLRIRSDGFLTS